MSDKNAARRRVVFFDFDNTITTRDVLDDLIGRFSGDDKWMEFEKKWKKGEIGSMECLKGQMKGVRITKSALDRYLSTIKIDPYFKKLVKFFHSHGIKSVILSDNFDYILNTILSNNGIGAPEIFSNRISLRGGRLIPAFPYSNKDCGDCAHCKKTSLEANAAEGVRSVYIGDGLSDVCASGGADTVFAKDYLKSYFKEKGLPHIPIKNLKDVYEYFLERRRI
ncbi:MAG: MtnX-like HAD-IB family phosphatase [Candidatus Omnitrophota bacterium]|nr:MtnX-like HAD-IB family phosphatase [Candidatus Omnitrophota bacterium]